MRFVLTISFLVCFLGSQAQYKNAVKTNLTGLGLQLYSLQYERMLSENLSFNNTFFYRPKVDIPFGTAIDNLAKDKGVGLTGLKFDHIFMDEAKMGVKGWSPEFRWYFGKKNNRPFVGLFGMFEKFDMQVPAELLVKKSIDDQNDLYLDVKIPINFTFETLSGGLLIGWQFNWNRIGLDFVLVGPHFGKSTNFFAQGKNEAIVGLKEHEKEFLLENVKERFGLQDKYFSMDITDTSAEIRSVKPVPYFGIRAVGLNLSYRF